MSGRIYSLAVLVCLGCLGSPLTADDAEKKAIFKAGAAAIDVTPPPGLPMWGYGARQALPSQGTLDPLMATLIVLEVGTEKLALVGLDMGRSPARSSLAAIRKKVLEKAGVRNVFIVGSHTHHGPCLELEKVEPTASYIEELIDKLSAGIVEAAAAVRPAKMGLASVDVDLNRNRHTKIQPKPVDRELIVWRIDAVEGETIATLVNFAAHPTTRDVRVFKYSSDFPGPLREQVEKTLGGICVFLQGASGDLSTNRSGRTTDEYGVALGEKVVELVRSIEPVVPTAPSIAVREEEFRFETRVDLGQPLTYAKYCIAFFKDLVDAYVEEYRDGLRPKITVALLNGEVGLVGGSGEFFCSHSMRLKKRSRLPHTLFLGYCNGYHQYFPTIEAAAEGGYGADPEVSPAEIGAGERMIDRALFHLYDMKKKFKGLPAGKDNKRNNKKE